MPTIFDAQVVLDRLRAHNLDGKIIGSLCSDNISEHDIDILIDLTPLLRIIFGDAKIERTDWHGYYIYDTTHGDVDLFVIHPEHASAGSPADRDSDVGREVGVAGASDRGKGPEGADVTNEGGN